MEPQEYHPQRRHAIDEAKKLMPDTFLAGAEDWKVSAYLDLIIADWNFWPPQQYLTVETLDPRLIPLLGFGVQMFTVLFEQQRWTLLDFDYTDQGLNIRLDRVAKLDQSYKNLLELYKQQIMNYKKSVLVSTQGVGLGTPRFQSSIGQFLKIALGSSFSWNSP
jgi:hypothetical protein